MSELEEKLEGILGNPQAMAQIMSLAQSLNLGGKSAESNGSESSPEPVPSSAAPPSPSSEGGMSGLLGGLTSLDPRLLSAAANLIGQYQNGNDDQRTALLTALRPFVKEQRYAKLDKAIQIAKLSHLIRTALALFRLPKEEQDV